MSTVAIVTGAIVAFGELPPLVALIGGAAALTLGAWALVRALRPTLGGL